MNKKSLSFDSELPFLDEMGLEGEASAPQYTYGLAVEGKSVALPVSPRKRIRLNSTKDDLLSFIKEAGVPSELSLRDALSAYPSFELMRRELTETCGAEAVIAGLLGSTLPSLVPPSLHEWPVWYIRLPNSWEADMAALSSAELFITPIILRNPWTLLPGLFIHAGEKRHLMFHSLAIPGTFRIASEIGAVLAIYECNERIAMTAYSFEDACM